MPVGAACLVARSKLSRYVADLKQSTSTEKAGALIKTGYLASLKTGERITGSNIVQGLADMGVRNVTAAGDYVQALVRSAATGGRVKPYEMRNIASTVNLPGLKATARSFGEGLQQAKTIMETGINTGALDQAINGSPFGQNQTHFQNPILDKVTRGIGNYISAIHQPFYNVAFRTSMYGRLRLAGIRAGLSGEPLTQFINQGFANPTEDVFLGSHADAALTAFKNETVLSKLAGSVRSGVKRQLARPDLTGLTRAGYNTASVALDITIPFTRIAGAIANVAADYSPAGFVKAVASSMEPNPRLQADVAQRLVKASAGTGLVLWGMKAAQNGTVTGSLPTDPGERNRWDLEGKQPNSVKLGGKWRSITWLGPLSIPFLIGAEIERAKEAGTTSPIDLAWKGVGFFGKTMTEETFLQGINNLVTGLQDPEHKMAGVAAQSLPIPTAIPQIAAAVDPNQRQASTVGEKIQARLPFASKALPPRLNAFGDTLRRTSGAGAIADVSSPRQATDDQITRELDRLDINPGRIGSTVKMDSTKVKRTPREVNDLTTEFGPVKRAVLEEIITDPSYKTMSDDERKKTIEAALRDVTGASSEIDKARRAGDKVPRMTPREFISGAEAP
jgi:hypothetical protein